MHKSRMSTNAHATLGGLVIGSLRLNFGIIVCVVTTDDPLVDIYLYQICAFILNIGDYFDQGLVKRFWRLKIEPQNF